MNKIQAYTNFWLSFGWAVYDETHVPDNVALPYLTVEYGADSFGYDVSLTASIWTRSTSWEQAELKEMEIAEAISRGGRLVAYDDGAFWIRKGNPWAQRLSDASDDMVRRIVLNIEVEFID